MSLSGPFRASCLLRTAEFARTDDALSLRDQLDLTYQRASLIARTYEMTPEDVLYMTPKFWELHMDPILVHDEAASTLVIIQFNLAAGTLAPFAAKRSELKPILNKVLRFEISAHYLLTEIAHGLDARSMETFATLLPNGDFDLHTPNDGACKYMPTTAPFGGLKKVAIVFARLIVSSEDRGIRPFLVPLGNGLECCKGVSIQLLPPRGGTQPLDHSITRFTHVRLPAAALLGSLDMPVNPRANFLSAIWRVPGGALGLAMLSVPLLSVAACTLARYSMRQKVSGPDGTKAKWSSRTQHGPVLHTLAQTFVFKAFAKFAMEIYTDKNLRDEVRSGVAAAAKVTATSQAIQLLNTLGERSGNHGMFQHNNFLGCEMLMRGSRIAEGDALVLCIRLANELLIGRYELPKPKFPDCPIALHEAGLFVELQGLVRSSENHRSDEISGLLLPQCIPFVEAIGHRMAYEAAVSSGVDETLTSLYEIRVIMADSAWYSENLGFKRRQQIKKEEELLSAALPFIEKYLEDTGAEKYVVSPIVTTPAWDAFVQNMPLFTGNAHMDLYEDTALMSKL